ncbi:MAG: hypothetical protein HYZ53_29525 [Planctomycetes bacterium]|nr:hypothetical protein [Planctomycetota bacterium]
MKRTVTKTPADRRAHAREFLQEARRRSRENIPWTEFGAFAFGPTSPIFSKGRRPSEVVVDPLYVELRRLWLALGQRQGIIARAEVPWRPESTAGEGGARGRGVLLRRVRTAKR